MTRCGRSRRSNRIRKMKLLPTVNRTGSAITLVNLVLLTIALYLVVDSFYLALDAKLVVPERLAPAEQSSDVSVDRNVPALASYGGIEKRNLFNTLKASDQPAKAVDVEQLKPTELKLILWGTVVQAGDKSYAVIEDAKEKHQQLYQVGDPVQKATVKLILREKVILRVDDHDEVLEIEKLARKTGASRDRPAARNAGAPQSSEMKLDRALVDEALEDVNKLMKEVRIRPHPDGISLSGIKSRSLFRRMGLKNGDVITGVNGEEIKSVEDALGLYENLTSSTNVSLQLKRRGREKTIDYRIE